MEGDTDVPAIKDLKDPVSKSVYFCMSGWKEMKKVACFTSSSVSMCASLIGCLIISYRNTERENTNVSLIVRHHFCRRT